MTMTSHVSPLSLTGARTTLSLGLRNVSRVSWYRLRLNAGFHPVQRLPFAEPPCGLFFPPPVKTPGASRTLPAAGERHFGWFEPASESVVDWHRNPFTGKRPALVDAPWWSVPDDDASIGDIKAIWERSRFDWVVHLAQRAVLEGRDPVDELNGRLADWSAKNPPYRGHNWKCGQEASIRVMHLAAAALILSRIDDPSIPLLNLLALHLERIAPTVDYALAQDNNHGTSEAAALFIGGSWLERARVQRATAWHRRGRALLAERAARLIGADGSFSQYSVNYHRLMLDTLSLAEVWRRRLALAPLAAVVHERAAAACDWLHELTNPRTGDTPNVGANDGANLLPLTDADFRDHRPSVQLASALFRDGIAYREPGPWNAHLQWLGVESGSRSLDAPGTRLFNDGGYAVLRRGDAMVLLRFPRFRFRPSHADALHVDLVIAGRNMLRDAGTYSYGATPSEQLYFAGVQGHNTAQFDDREQMPRLGRFLWGDWLETAWLSPIRVLPDATKVGAAYTDARGATHVRRLTLGDRSLLVDDGLTGFQHRAVLRWRLEPGTWRQQGDVISSHATRVKISADAPIVRCEIVAGWESRYYLHRNAAPVVEVEIARPGHVSTEISWR